MLHVRILLLVVCALFVSGATFHAAPRPKNPTAVLSWVSTDQDGTVTLSTVGTRAAAKTALTKWQLTWGDGQLTLGANAPPAQLRHLYAEGAYKATLTVTDANGLTGTVTLAVMLAAPPPPPPPPPPGSPLYGPQASIVCPASAMYIAPGASIQTATSSAPAGTTFCIGAGVHAIRASITPKTGNTYIGEYGAILDGTSWLTTDSTAGAFRAHNQDIDYVTIRNLVIRKMPQRGIQAYYWMADHWTVEYTELAYNKYGIEFGIDFVIRHNAIHHNMGPCAASQTCASVPAAERGGGYAASQAHRTLFESNEIAYNGMEQKVLHSDGVVFRNNFVHHNLGDGIWYDTNYTANALIEGNVVEDNGRAGIDIEATNGAIVRHNSIRRNRDDGVFIFRSQRVETYGNTIEGNLGGVEYFILCEPMLPGEDLANNSTHDNVISVGTGFSGPWVTGFSYPATCPDAEIAPYRDGQKGLTFSNNTYVVPSATGTYWLWGGWRSWSQWQGLGQDLTGRIQ